MKAGWAVAFLVALLWGPLPGAGLESIRSRLLDRDVPITVHVPAAEAVTRWRSAHPGQPLRLVLFLPGAFDGPRDFIRQGLDAHLSEQEAAGHLPPSLWVAVTHFQSWYADRDDGSLPFERFLMEELIPMLEVRHPGFGGSPQARSLAGLSMGGFGALNLAARTAAFSKCLALSPALIEPPFRQVSWWIRRSLTRTFSMDPARFEPWNPRLHLGGSVALVVGCGTEDKYGLANACRAFAMACEARNRPLHLELRPGGHDWAYWTPAFKAWMPWLLSQEESNGFSPGPVAKSRLGSMIGP